MLDRTSPAREPRRVAARAALLACAATWLAACRTNPTAPHEPGAPSRAPRPEALDEAALPPAPEPAQAEAPAFDATGADATLAAYVRRAELASPGLAAAWNDWMAARERVPQSAALPDPRLTYRHFVEEVETRVGPQERALELSQALPARGRLGARERQAELAAEAAGARYEARRLALVAEVRSAWYEAYWLDRATRLVRENRDLVERLEEVARRRYASGGAEYADVIRAQVELGTLDDRIRSLLDRRGSIAARLNAALDRPPDAPIAWPEAVPHERLDANDEQVFAWLEATSPELAAQLHAIGAAEQGIELARTEGRPDWTVGVQWIDTGDAIAPVPGSGKDPLSVTIGLSLPLNRGRYDAAEREAEARVRAETLRWDELRNARVAHAANVLYELRDAERRIELRRETLVPLANQALETAEAAYRGGQATFLDLVDAEQLLLELQLATERARADHGQRRAELERLVGRPVPFRTVADEDDPETKGDAEGGER